MRAPEPLRRSVSKRLSVLIIDDDDQARKLVRQTLQGGGFEIAEEGDLESVTALLAGRVFDVVLMEIKYHDQDGLAACKYICNETDAVVIAISWSKDVLDRILALEFGASDFLIKPFHPRELLARLKNAMGRNRFNSDSNAPIPAQFGTFIFGKYELQSDKQKLRLPDGSTRKLTLSECNLLVTFLGSPKRVLSRDQLTSTEQIDSGSSSSRAIDASVKRLRQKLRVEGVDDIIRTVSGLGYMMNEEVEISFREVH
ncbi:MAG: response regulator transcription factor [Caulobacteraceae bacterium]